MATWKGEIQFAEGARGWREDWYSSAYDNSALALASLVRVAFVRGLALGTSTRLVSARVSDVAVRGDSNVRWFRVIPPGSKLQTKFQSDQASNGWLLRVEATDTVRRAVWLRGMPDAWYDLAQGGSVDQPTIIPDMRAWLDQWLTVLQKEAWGIYGITSGFATANAPIVSLTKDNVTGRLVITTAPGAPVPTAYQQVRLYRLSKANRLLIGSLQSCWHPTPPSWISYTQYDPNIAYAGGAYYRVLVRTVQLVRSIQPVRVGVRATGRVTYITRARRRV